MRRGSFSFEVFSVETASKSPTNLNTLPFNIYQGFLKLIVNLISINNEVKN